MFQLFFVEYTKNLTIFLFIFQGEQDIVRCFCCDLGLAEWDAKDDAWREHARHNPGETTRIPSFYMQIIKIKCYSNKLHEVCGIVW
jgi:hypothetical protein